MTPGLVRFIVVGLCFTMLLRFYPAGRNEFLTRRI